jgi:hypothetical protein
MSERDSLLDRLIGGAIHESEDPRAAQFVRGLALGALVGAAIAGSTLWGRRRAAAERGQAAAEIPPALPPEPAPRRR